MEAPVAAILISGMLLLASTVQISASISSTSTTSTTSATPVAASSPKSDLDFCASVRSLRLAAGSTGSSSVQLRLTPEPATSLQAMTPCLLDVSAPASNFLRLKLVPLVEDDEEDDGYAGPRRGRDLRDQDARQAGEEADEEVDSSATEERESSSNFAAGNDQKLGFLDLDLMLQNAMRAESSLRTPSCTLTLRVDDEPVWSADLCDADDVRSSKSVDNIPHNSSFSWMPPTDGRKLLVSAITITAMRKGIPAANICSLRTVRLAGQGVESGVVLELRDTRPPEDRVGPCRLQVTVPHTHRLSLIAVGMPAEGLTASSSSSDESSPSSVEVDAESSLDVAENAASEDVAMPSKPSCGLSLYQGRSPVLSDLWELWSVDLCDGAATSTLNFTEFFPGNVTLVWTPPTTAHKPYQLSSSIVLTAIGVGPVCSSGAFHPCRRRPRHQPLCVASELVCDGYSNCPSSGDSDDEGPAHCSPPTGAAAAPGRRQTERPSPPDAKDLLVELFAKVYNSGAQNSPSSREHVTHHRSPESPDTLSNYGPWGYLMLGMLVCGAFLMLCGLWECCCRQPKTTPTAPSHAPTTVLMPQVGATRGVLVLDPDLDDGPPRPPAYEDLDQPPSYGVLFPPGLTDDLGLGLPKDDAPPVVALAVATAAAPSALHADASFPDADADDIPSLHSSSSSSTPSMVSATSDLSLAPS